MIDENVMKRIIFVHVPKTAGTSFRLAAEKYFGSENVVFDYTEAAKETSASVQELIYKRKDKDSFKDFLHNETFFFLGGHFEIKKYLYCGSVNDVVAFVREPWQRVISEYKHFVRHFGYDKGFQVFIKEPEMKSKQSWYLNGVPLQAIGHIGLTESYEAELEIINKKFYIEVESLERNLGGGRAKEVHSEFSEFKKDFELLNAKDIELYEKAVEISNQKKDVINSGCSFVHGAITKRSSDEVHGWAWYENSDESPQLEFYVNGKLLSEDKASKDVEKLSWYPPKNGKIGFLARGPFGDSKEVEVFVKNSQQQIFDQFLIG